jgi:uncharacterized protein
VLPAAASLQKQGANRGATTAFLISTPESGVDSIAITYALLDPIMTVVRPVAAFVTAMSAGVLENIITFPKQQEKIQVSNSCPVDNCCDGIDCPPERHKRHHTLFQRVKAGLRFAVVDVWGDIVMWFFAGLLLAGIITTLIPDDLMAGWLGGGLVSMLLMLIFGIPLYICATASTPIAAALILKGVSPGAALVFLLVGPATNITSLSVLVGILGKKGVIRYLLVLSVMAVLFGLGVDFLYRLLGISPMAIIGEAGEIVPYGLKLGAVIILILLSIRPFWELLKKLHKSDKSTTTYYSGFPSIGKIERCSATADPHLDNSCNTERIGHIHGREIEKEGKP